MVLIKIIMNTKHSALCPFVGKKNWNELFDLQKKKIKEKKKKKKC